MTASTTNLAHSHADFGVSSAVGFVKRILNQLGERAGAAVDRSRLAALAPRYLDDVGLTVAEFDPGYLASQTMALAGEFIMRDDRCLPLLWNEDHNHVSPLLSIGTGSGTLAADLAALLLRLGGAADDSQGRHRADA